MVLNMNWFYLITELVLLFAVTVTGYRIIEYSFDDDDDDTGSGGTDISTFIEGGKKNFLLNLIAKTTIPSTTDPGKLTSFEKLQSVNSNQKYFIPIETSSSKLKEEFSTTLEQIRKINKYKLNITAINPEENGTSRNKSKNRFKQSTCLKNAHCKATKVCNLYARKCERCRIENEICRKSRNCCGNKQCIWGRCIQRGYGRREGNLCSGDKDCGKDLCCAREDGQSICKKYVGEGDRCDIPHGGLIFSVTHNCPCAVGLQCRVTSWKPRRRTCVK